MHVSFNRSAESVFCAFHEVATTATMDVKFNATRHNVASFSVNDFSSYYREIVVGYLKDFAPIDDNTTAFEPTVGREDSTIGDLLKHEI